MPYDAKNLLGTVVSISACLHPPGPVWGAGRGVSITIGESWKTALALSCGQLLFLTLVSPNILKLGNLCTDESLKSPSKGPLVMI